MGTFGKRLLINPPDREPLRMTERKEDPDLSGIKVDIPIQNTNKIYFKYQKVGLFCTPFFGKFFIRLFC
jgi:hypothetical protein